MEESTTKEKVLKRVRNALISKTSSPYSDVDMAAPVYQPITDALDITFAQELTNVGGHFIYCENMDEMTSTLSLLIQTNNLNPVFCADQALYEILRKSGIQIQNDRAEINNIRASVTTCEFLIARLGSVMVSSRTGHGRQLNIYPETHIVVAYSSQLVPDLKQAFTALKERYQNRMPSMVNVITGPSRTADIEKTLVMGAHGPRELYVFLIDDLNN